MPRGTTGRRLAHFGTPRDHCLMVSSDSLVCGRLDAAAEMHPGGHEMLGKTDELVAYLLDAAGIG